MDVNRQLWDVEDDLRDLEKMENFDDEFVQKREVCTNSTMNVLGCKKSINIDEGSNIIEEKSH